MRRASTPDLTLPTAAPRRRPRPARGLLAIAAALTLAAAFVATVAVVRGRGAVAAPAIALPHGFAPLARYRRLARDYRFSGSSLPADWTAGSGNYGPVGTDFVPSQVSLNGSAVMLHASRSASAGGRYLGGLISTVGHFTMTRGLVEFRARMPSGAGLWSGLWADNGAASHPESEIDIVEMLLRDTHTVYGSLHEWGPAQWSLVNHARLRDNAAGGFHDYEAVLQPGMVTWAVDGVAYAQYTRAQALASGHPWPFDSARGIYLIADLAVGSTQDWAGPPNAATRFPAAMELRWVRVWQ